MKGSHRLKGLAFERKSNTREPHKVIILSVEGHQTERKYFRYLNKLFANGDLPLPRCTIHLLDKDDHHSDPESVLELLEAGHALRSGKYNKFFSTDFFGKYTEQKIRDYFDRRLFCQEEREFERDAFNQGLDVKRLREICYPRTDGDVFGVVIDHDGRSNIESYLKKCERAGFNVFLTTPCFELWLLCHFVDVKENYDLEQVFKNKKVSKQHTFISKELSEITRINRGINEKNKKIIRENTFLAIERIRDLETDVYQLVNRVGSSLPLLFEIIKGERSSIWSGDAKVEVASGLDD